MKREQFEDVGPTVRSLMAEHGLTREQIAKRIGVGSVTVWLWLRGGHATKLAANQVRALAKRLAKGRPKNS